MLIGGCSDIRVMGHNTGFLLVSPEYLEGLVFSAIFGEAEKFKVSGQAIDL